MGSNLESIWDFGMTPLANSYPDNQDGSEDFYPLETYFCTDCSNVQLGHIVDSKTLFTDYLYASSTSPVFRKHFENFAKKYNDEFHPNRVLDIGSNDGILLKPFMDLGVTVFGVEPSQIPTTVPTIHQFFTTKTAEMLLYDPGKFDLITATNVFAHVDDLDEIVNGVKMLLTDEGQFVVEVVDIDQLLKKKTFDLVYHEHVQTWSLETLKTFFRRHDMTVVDAEDISTHGGSIRVYVKKGDRGIDIDWDEKYLKYISTYRKFSRELLEQRQALTSLLYDLKIQGKTIAGYGAPAKATTLLHYFGIGRDILDFIVDDSPLKQGRFIPGKRIPIVISEEIQKQKPDYILILAWNFAESIMEKYPEYKGQFVVPFPNPKIV